MKKVTAIPIKPFAARLALALMAAAVLLSLASCAPLGTVPGAFTLSYDGNGATTGSVPASPTQYREGDSITVLGNTGSLGRPGYQFYGWNVRANGNGTDYPAGSTLIMESSDVIL